MDRLASLKVATPDFLSNQDVLKDIATPTTLVLTIR
jgi:hypothetical protein